MHAEQTLYDSGRKHRHGYDVASASGLMGMGDPGSYGDIHEVNPCYEQPKKNSVHSKTRMDAVFF